MSVIEQTSKGNILRVRLCPNSSSCKINGIYTDTEQKEHLKINVISIPEKGKANKELIIFLAKKLKLAKSEIEIISGDTDRQKKVLLKTNIEHIENWLKKEGYYND